MTGGSPSGSRPSSRLTGNLADLERCSRLGLTWAYVIRWWGLPTG